MSKEFCLTCLQYLTNENIDYHYELQHEIVTIIPNNRTFSDGTPVELYEKFTDEIQSQESGNC